MASELLTLVPKTPAENLRWRIRMRKAAMEDQQVREALYDAAMIDVLFFFNAFAWLFEPRGTIPVIPFVTWPHQDPVIEAIDQTIATALESEVPVDVVIDKSRAQGGTYIYLTIFIRRWLRDPMFVAGLVTRNENLVDSMTDTDSLLFKADWILKQLPYWMLPAGFDPRKHRALTDHTIINPENGSLLVGYAAGQDVARGGRKTVFVADEIGALDFIKGGKDEEVMSALHDVTNCVILCSTQGAEKGVFYEAVNSTDTNAVKLVLDWKDNPKQTVGAYVMRDGMAKAVRPEEQPAVDRYIAKHQEDLARLSRRGYAIEGKFRSPWYDARCLRPGATPRLIAKELDRNPRGAVGKVFDPEVLDRMKRDCCRVPVWQGKIVFDNESLELKGLIRVDDGPLKLWFKPGVDDSPPSGRFVIGCDIAAGGTGVLSSPSVVCGMNADTGEQILEWAAMGWMATKFARLAMAIGLWLNKAYMVYEETGAVGTAFGKEVVEEFCYGNIYYREVDTIGDRSKTRKPGWRNSGDEAKTELFEAMCIAFDEGHCIPRSVDLIRECAEYEWENGKIIYRPARRRDGVGTSHGDRCVAAGCAWLGCRDRPGTKGIDYQDWSNHNPPYGSPAWRQVQAQAEIRNSENEFTIESLLT